MNIAFVRTPDGPDRMVVERDDGTECDWSFPSYGDGLPHDLVVEKELGMEFAETEMDSPDLDHAAGSEWLEDEQQFRVYKKGSHIKTELISVQEFYRRRLTGEIK